MKRRWIVILIVVVVAAGTAFLLLRGGGADKQQYRTAQVERGDLEATVTSTGTITAVGTVEVGTQVSGEVEAVFVDFNDQVRRGQLLARLDTRVLQASVDDARAQVERVQAQYAAALDQYNRNKPLYEQKYISAIEFNQYRSSLDAARASVTSAQVALQRARTNLGYADIRSPTDGTVIQRTVEPGQTVAASLSSPTLFTIANDLSQMQIEANVDESDIGQIKEGQRASFTVQSQANKNFTGIVRQIRLQPTTVQNVVNYTVVVDAPNQEGLLLPGMTATVNFEVARAGNVLVVPNAALRFQPPPEVLEEYRKRMGEQGDSGSQRSRAGGGSGNGRSSTRRTAAVDSTGAGGSQGGSRVGRARIWTLDEAGALRMIPVAVGLSDGQRTEISGKDVREGLVVVTGVVSTESNAPRTGTGLPFGGGSGGGGGGRRGF